MPVYTCRERPPVAALFRSGRPMREWGLAEACASNGAVFASTVFADEETQEALRMLAAELFKPGAAVREVASCVGKQDATRASLLGDESSPAGKRSHDHLISEGATGDLRGPSRKVAARTEHCAGRGPAFCDRGNDSMDLSDDDFDLLVTKRPASTHALPSGIRRKGNAVVASGRDGHLIPGDSQNLQELPINHYEKMVQSRHDADAEEPSPWDRALLPAGRGPGRLVEAENVADKASSRKHGSGGAMREGGGKKKDSGIAPFFGGVAQGKMDKARKEVQCSNCHQVGHTKRTCPSADSAREKDGAGNEKKGQKKSKLDACENDPQQSVNEKLSALSVSGVVREATQCLPVLGAAFSCLVACTKALGLVYGSAWPRMLVLLMAAKGFRISCRFDALAFLAREFAGFSQKQVANRAQADVFDAMRLLC